MKSIFFFLLASGLFISSSFAQDEAKKESPHYLSVHADVMSRYIWRGLVFSPAVNIQPLVDYTYKGLSVGSWGSYGVGTNYFETDLYLSYSLGNLSITLFDYYNEMETAMDSVNYFNFKAGETWHMLEATLAYTISEDFPLTVTAATFFYGADYNYTDKKQFYSTYLELAYAFSVKEVSANVFLGGCLNKGLYADKAAIVNVGVKAVKNIKLSDTFELPISGSFILNPYAEDVFLVLGLHF
jgi:hypothetical protein